jgi:hypothetical protein
VIYKLKAHSFACMVLLASIVCGESVAQQPGELGYQDTSMLPAGIVGERITSLIATFNSGDRTVIERFLEEECTASFRNFAPLERHLNVFTSTRRSWGEVTFHGVRTYDPPRHDETVVILRDDNFGAWRAFTLQFDVNQNSRISSIGLNDARTPTNVTEPALTQQDMIHEVTDLLNRTCERDVFSGSVLVAKGEDVQFTHACGEARECVPSVVGT